MRSLAVRVIILLLFVAAAGASAYLVWAGESRARSDADAARRFDERAIAAARDALDLRAAQQAYVAAGQGEQFWIAKVAAGSAALEETLATLKTAAAAAEAQSAIGSAADALSEFKKMDRRAREYTQGGQKLLASDLVFSTGLETTGGVIGFLDEARTAESRSRGLALADIRRLQGFALGAVAGAASLALLLLVPVPRPREEVSLRLTDRSIEPRSTLAPAIDEGWAPARKAAPAPVPPPTPAAPAAPAFDMATLAAVCTELARIENTQALPQILERTAGALEASGIVLWISDPDGHELAPVLTHGYPQQIVTRLARIQRDAENATAAAFRTGLLQTVKADVMLDGAIAAPLLTHAGCVGVMAAEVRKEGEKDPAKLAAAAIVAAQIATLVGPPTRAQAAEAAGA